MPRFALFLATAFAALSIGLSSSAEADGEAVDPAATAIVERLHTVLLDVMQNADELGYAGRYERLSPVLQEVFDISFMAEKSVGRHWKKAEDTDRTELRATFERFMIANYAGRFDRYSGQHFETLGGEEATRGTVIIHTRLVDSDEVVQLNYRLRPVEGSWRIIDVYLNGTVSELALRRSEYSSLIKREGFKALIVALDEKIADLAAGTAAES